jgi:hypothetical protein
MEKSSMSACLRFFGLAKLLLHVGVGVVHVSREVKFLGASSLQLVFQCIEGRGQCELSHADEGTGEMRGSNCDHEIEDWEANLNDQGQEEVERWEARCRRVFVEGREDIECIRDYEGSAHEEGNVDECGRRRRRSGGRLCCATTKHL